MLTRIYRDTFLNSTTDIVKVKMNKLTKIIGHRYTYAWLMAIMSGQYPGEI